MATKSSKRSKSALRSSKKPSAKKAKAKKSTAKKPAAKKPAAIKGPKLIYYFGQTRCDGRGNQKPLLGGKGANLAEMTSIGLPVPPGFTITTEVCDLYYKNGRKFPATLLPDIRKHVAMLEAEVGRKLGDAANPLLVSIRSGARDSMPGMMDTILNLGLNDQTVLGLKAATNNGRFAYDCYRRFIQMYGDVVMGVQSRNEQEHEPFDAVMSKLKDRAWREGRHPTRPRLIFMELIGRYQQA